MQDRRSLEDALRRAAREHGIKLQQTRPSMEALRAAIREYRELFRPTQTLALEKQRRLALQAMTEFARFRPRLTGALLDGDGPLDVIQLLVTADSAEQVILHLADRHIPWQEAEVIYTHSGGRRRAWPALRFVAGEATIELTIIDRQGWSDPPRDCGTGGPLAMLGAAELDALVGEAST